MNMEFLKLFLTKEDFPPEARQFLLESAAALTERDPEGALLSAADFFRENDFNIQLTRPVVEETAKLAGLSPYTVWMLLLIEASQDMREAFSAEGREDLYWATFADLRYKALECKEIYGVWGTFVAFWYPIFYTKDIVKLGRLEYENIEYGWDTPYVWGGVALEKGVPVKNIHIPSSGEPFDEAARLDSYKKAYDYFKDELHGGPLCCVCHSWLLYPEYGKLLKPGSHIRGFQGDFAIVGADTEEEFGDAWRLFGADYQKPTAELPERTSMQKAFKEYLLAGGKTGEGRGVLLFDGKRILNKN